MFEIICDGCGVVIGQCSKDLENEQVFCTECRAVENEDDDEETPAEEEEDKEK